MRSMTGFGIGYAPFGAGRMCIELKSLNHRYLDVRVRVPTELGDHAFYLEHLARSRLVRGRFDIQLRTDGHVTSPPCLDMERVRSLFRQVSTLRDELAPGSDIALTALLGLPNVYLESDDRHVDRVRSSMDAAFAQAHEKLEEMRAREGAHLAQVLGELLERAGQLVKSCAERADASVRIYSGKLHERVARLVEDPSVSVEAGRLEQEIALMADRSDISEEVARLGSHFSQFRALIDSAEPSGRRMDFLLQEIGRESNTLGAKSQDAALSHLVVELKAETERMREQVQNVE